MQIILEYSDENFKRLEERAFINSRNIGEYIRKVIDYPANTFDSWKIVPDAEPEFYVSDKPKITKPKRKKRKTK